MEKVELGLRLNNLFKVMSADKKLSASLSVFSGRAYWKVFDNSVRGGKPKIMIGFGIHVLHQLAKAIAGVLANPEAKAKTIFVGRFVREGEQKGWVYDNYIQVGRKDQNCFIRFINNDNKDGFGFILTADATFKIDGTDLPPKEASEVGMDDLLYILDKQVAQILLITNVDNGTYGDAAAAATSSSPAASSVAADMDIPF